MAHTRILALAQLCPRTGPLVDIGSDHGLLVRYLYQQGFPYPLYASELTAASFQGLKASLEDLPIHVYQADGLARLPKAITSVVIAGMGGQLISKILTQGETSLSHVNHLILAPHRDAALLRTWLMDHGWQIQAEAFILEANHGYPLMLASKGNMVLDVIQRNYGPILIQKKAEDFCRWLQQEAILLKEKLRHVEDEEKRQCLEWITQYVKNR